MAQAAYEYAIEYAKDRDVFGVKVAQKQAIAFMLAEMGTDIEATRLLAWEAAWMLDEGKEEAYQSMLTWLTRRGGYGDDGHRSGCPDPGRPWLYQGTSCGTVDEKRPGLFNLYRPGNGLRHLRLSPTRTSVPGQRKEKYHD